MKVPILFAVALFTLSACKKNSEQLPEKNRTADSQRLENNKICYLSVIGNDSVRLSFQNLNSDNITGDLDFRSPETDGSVGNFTGTKSGDTLKLKSRTVAEGFVSYNDIYLLEKDGKLFEGIGEVSKINDSTTVFAHPSKIDYTKSYVFSKTDCK